MSSRPLEHLVLLTVATTVNREDGEECSTVLIAWRILNISTNKVVSEQEIFVQPSEGVPPSSALPPGVSPASLQGACKLDIALKRLHDSLTKLAGTTFSIMTNGPLTLRQLLHPEAQKLGISPQKYLYHYLDLNKEMRVSYPSAPVTNDLNAMAEFLGLNNIGDEPSVGLVELHRFSDIVEKLISEGHVFHKLEVIKEFDSSKTIPERGLVKSESVILLKGLPYSAEVKDVARFLAGLNILPGGIVFMTNQIGRRTGASLVAMETSELAELALQRNRRYIGQRYIDVVLSTVDEFWKLADPGVGGTGKDSVLVLRMQGLPYRVSEEEIVDFFAPDASVMSGQEGVLLIRYPDGRASGDGYALFSSERDLKAAMERDRQNIPGYSRYVELYKSSVKDLKAVLSTSATREQQTKFSQLLGVSITANPEIENLRGSERKCVKLRGLPYDSKPDDVLSFFGDLKNDIAAKGVHMVLNANNMPTGDCYVQMKSEDSARKAFNELNKKYMGRRYIEVFQCSGDEVARVLMEQGIGGGGGSGYRGSSYRGDRGGGKRGYGGGGRRRRGSGSRNVVKARGLPYSASEEEVADFFAEFEVCVEDVELIYNRDNRPAGIALVSFQSRELAQDAVREKNKKYLGGRYLELSFSSE